MSLRHRIATGVAGIAALLAMTGAAPAQQKLRDVTLVLSSSSLGPASPRVAKEMGLFEKHGLNAKVVPMDTGNTAIAALLSKTADAALVGPGTLLAAEAQGQKLVIIANAYGGFATVMVLAKPVADKLGVSPTAPVAERLKAVNGLVIATQEATAGATLGFKTAAATVGSTIRFTYIAQNAMQAALESGAIQGYLATAPYWAGPIATGKGVVWINGPRGELPPGTANGTSSVVQMLRSTAEADPALVKALSDVFADFHHAIDEHPDVVKAATARVFPSLSPTVLDIVFPSESAAWNGKTVTAADMVREIEFVKASGTQILGIENVKPESMLLP